MKTSRSISPSISFRTIRIAALSATLTAVVFGGLLAGCQQEIISHNPQSRAEGMKDYDAGNYADAAGAFRNAIRSDPRDYKSQFYLAECYENMKQYQQAIQAYKASADAQGLTLAGQDDEAQRLRTTEALAACISKSDDRDSELNIVEAKARAGNQSSDWLLLGKIYEDRGDVDSALDAFNRAVLVNPKDFIAAKQYGLYLEQVGQKQKAAYSLKKAYILNPNDEQVNSALARLNIVAGPGLKDKDDLAKPPIPEGPLPEVDLSKFKIGGSSSDASEPPQVTPAPAPAAPAPQPGATPHD